MKSHPDITRPLPVVALALLLTACAQSPATPPPRDTVDAAVATGLGAAVWPDGERSEAMRQQRVGTLLGGTLDVGDALEMAALADYEIAALLAELEAQRAATQQEGLLPNPAARLMAMLPRDGGRIMLDYGLMQELVETLTRGRRLAIAEEAERAAAYLTAETILLRLWSVEVAWVEAVAAIERKALWVRREQLAVERAALADAFAARGVLAQEQAATQQARAAEALQRAAQVGDDAEITRARLAEALGLASSDGLKLPAQLPRQTGEPGSPEELREAALALRLDLLAAQATALRDRDSLQLVLHWRYLPRLGVGIAGDREADGSGGLGAEVAVTVPLFDQGQVRLAGAAARLAVSDARVEARRRQVQAGVDRAFATWQRERERVSRLGGDVRPALERVLELRERNYRDGLSDRFAVLDAGDELLALDMERLAAREAQWLARIELARQTGSALPRR